MQLYTCPQDSWGYRMEYTPSVLPRSRCMMGKDHCNTVHTPHYVAECRIILPSMAVAPSPIKRDLERPKTSIFLLSTMLRRVVSFLLCVPRVLIERTFQEAMVVLSLAMNAALSCLGCL